MRKKCKNLTTYFARYFIRMLNLYYPELMGKTEEYEGKKYLITDDYM